MAASQWWRYSLFCALLCFFCFHQSSCFRAINAFTGDLTAEATDHHTVWQIPDTILICALFSDLGDADVYISIDRRASPGSVVYDYVSDSCGDDVLVVLSTSKGRQLHIDVLGHFRYANTSYRLYIIKAEKEDMERYSVKESWIREDGTSVELVRAEFADPLAIRSDTELVKVVDGLRGLRVDEHARDTSGNEGGSTFELLATVAAKVIEIAVEVLL